MNDFREAYKNALNDVADINISANSVMDEIRHKKIQTRRKRQQAVTVISFALILCVSGITTVKAAGYFNSIIKVSKDGFKSGDAVTMAQAETDEETTEEVPAYEVDESTGTTEAVVMGSIVNTEYDSVEAMLQAYPDLIIVYPDDQYTEGASTNAIMAGNMVYIRYQFEDGSFFMIERTDYGDSLGHAATTVFPGGVCNERTYTTDKEFSYTIIDSVKEDENEPLQIHAAISVGNYEVYVNYYGYEEEEAYKILDDMDLSPYLQ